MPTRLWLVSNTLTSQPATKDVFPKSDDDIRRNCVFFLRFDGNFEAKLNTELQSQAAPLYHNSPFPCRMTLTCTPQDPEHQSILIFIIHTRKRFQDSTGKKIILWQNSASLSRTLNWISTVLWKPTWHRFFFLPFNSELIVCNRNSTGNKSKGNYHLSTLIVLHQVSSGKVEFCYSFVLVSLGSLSSTLLILLPVTSVDCSFSS